MVEQVDAFLPMFAPLQPAFVTFHPEVSRHPVRTIEAIRAAGGVPGIALDPGLAVATIEPLLAEVGVVCIMTVSPGYAGQKLIPWTLEKIAVLRERRAQAGLDFRIEVDGNASWENIPHMQAAGADIIVAGSSSLFSDRIPRREALRRLRGVMEAPSKPVEQTEGGAP
jgi:ribulose-phosphate 3-epimerase